MFPTIRSLIMYELLLRALGKSRICPEDARSVSAYKFNRAWDFWEKPGFVTIKPKEKLV